MEILFHDWIYKKKKIKLQLFTHKYTSSMWQISGLKMMAICVGTSYPTTLALCAIVQHIRRLL